MLICQTDPALQGARLQLLIESLKSGGSIRSADMIGVANHPAGANIYNDPRFDDDAQGGVDEVGVIIGDA